MPDARHGFAVSHSAIERSLFGFGRREGELGGFGQLFGFVGFFPGEGAVGANQAAGAEKRDVSEFLCDRPVSSLT